MIRVIKPAAPARLARGAALIAGNRALYDANPATYDTGASTFDIDKNIYGHADVKDVLRVAQHRKCCFCEGVFEGNAPADVEHFRPKKYAQQGRGGRKLYPGYYWLGYTWENLYYCCEICNRSQKKNYFPLRDSAARARNHLADLAGEEPLILDPGGPLDPRAHISFNGEVAIGSTDEGRTTVEYVGLNRPALIDARLESLNLLKILRDIRDAFEGPLDHQQRRVINDANQILEAAVQPTAKFSAMAMDLLHPPAAT